jgi:hypothetical protein
MFKKIEIKPIHFVAVILVLIILMMGQCSRISGLKAKRTALETKITRVENNILASNDSVAFYKNGQDYYISQISGFEKTKQELLDQKDQAYQKYVGVLDLNKKLKGVNNLLRIEISTKDSIINSLLSVTNNLDGTSTINIADNKEFGDNNWRKFKGSVLIKKQGEEISALSSNFLYEQNIMLYSSLETIDGRKKIKIATKYPGINFNTIENISVIEDELNKVSENKKMKFGVSMGVMYGATVIGNQVYLAPMVGFGFTITPKWLQF